MPKHTSHDLLEHRSSLWVGLVARQCWLCIFLTDYSITPRAWPAPTLPEASYVCAVLLLGIRCGHLLHTNLALDTEGHLPFAGPAQLFWCPFAPFAAGAHSLQLICTSLCLLCQHALISWAISASCLFCFALCASTWNDAACRRLVPCSFLWHVRWLEHNNICCARHILLSRFILMPRWSEDYGIYWAKVDRPHHNRLGFACEQHPVSSVLLSWHRSNDCPCLMIESSCVQSEQCDTVPDTEVLPGLARSHSSVPPLPRTVASLHFEHR